MTDEEDLHVDSRDATLVIVIDIILSFLLQRVMTTSLYIASMVVIFVCSCAYVSVMAHRRYEDEMKDVRKLFG